MLTNDTIFQYDMTLDEAEVYSLAVLYQSEFLKTFKPEEIDGQAIRRNTLPKRSDPRKSNLFRHCWKLRRETRGLLEADEYRPYILANLVILKANQAHIEPNAICGNKAWIRWKIWKRWHDRKLAELASLPPPPSISETDPKIIREIDRTKKFLFERCEGQPTKQKIQQFVEQGIFKIWVITGKVSQFYVSLSPFILSKDNLMKECSIDPNLISEMITEQVRRYFATEFKHEFQ